ncbi:DUF2827 domain-containing protein [Hydromonas duriensis]|uniref:Uncharacterized protein DUF2827 n=1 Tax=Hydromonas duriensis TaxID=1527608 RepID=A0A4R6Y754_9BURK|nr:DUF2827 domain-containing protein [Hydromonas duriensis]TDR31002.1 uncharacterized protein DUF2827 [Hydromonas duriensis]
MTKKLNIGISIFAVKDINIWANGLNMNLAFLVQLLRQSPDIGKVYLLNGGDLDAIPEGLEFGGLDAQLVRPHDVTHDVDVVIEMGAQLPVEWLHRVHALGVKLVSFLVGHTYCSNIEAAIFERPSGQMFNDVPWAETWTLPQYAKTCIPMLQTITRAPVVTMPHIWSPMFIEQRIKTLGEKGQAFGFKPHEHQAQPRAWRAAVFEPNISVAKNCVIAMLACEAAYRLEKQSIGLMMAMNTFHMKEHQTFNRLASHLDLTRDSKASYEPRVAFVEGMIDHQFDVVVSHQWENAQNYLYYDTLYGGYPLVHNSPFMQEAGMGFYYPEFEAQIGGEVLVQAWRKDAEFWADYSKRSNEFLKTLAPDHPENIGVFVQRLKHLAGARV